MRLFITGATGYVGTRLVRRALEKGYDVTAATRRDPGIPGVEWVSFDLLNEDPPAIPEHTDVVIHLAAELKSPGRFEEEEVRAATMLMEVARKKAARFLFVSSQTARSDAPTAYGRIKWRIEERVKAADGIVVRPGLVYGGPLHGLFGRLVHLGRSNPVLPGLFPAPWVQPVHIDDLCSGMLKLVALPTPPLEVNLASEAPVSFNSFLDQTLRIRAHKRPVFVPVPALGLQWLLGSLDKWGMLPPSLTSLRSLLQLPVMETRNSLAVLGLDLRSLSMGLHPSGDGRRRALLWEGRTLIGHLMRENPGGAIVRRYVRAVEELRNGLPLGLPAALLRFPCLLALFNRQSGAGPHFELDLADRLDIAAVLAEATPQGAVRFLGLGRPHGLTRTLALLVRAVSAEALWRLLRLLARPLLLRAITPTSRVR